MGNTERNMRVLIIGLDSADYDFITGGKYPHLKQVEYGKVKINVSSLFTPVIWASFITGVGEEKHGITGMHRWDNKLVNSLRDQTLHLRLPKKVGEMLDSVGSFLASIGTSPKLYSKSDLRVPTIFDYAEKHIAISIPSYNEDSANQILRGKLKNVLGSGNMGLMKEVETLAWRLFRERKEKLLDSVNEDWDLLMCHFYVLDVLQHLFWFDAARLSQAYEEMDRTVESVQKAVSHKSDLFLVVSDHGQRRGIHTPYGFYSASKKLRLNMPRITDFADVIRSNLGLPSREDEMKVFKHLQRLGYF